MKPDRSAKPVQNRGDQAARRSGGKAGPPVPGKAPGSNAVRTLGRWREARPAYRQADDVNAASAGRQLRRAARQRRQFERSEVKRFTRHARRRRLGWLVAASITVMLAAIVAIAVYSPLFALRTIKIEGASRVDTQ
ncbi:MAG: hypothetical protein ACYCZK_08070, partial [Microbacteriaceae bacterium]